MRLETIDPTTRRILEVACPGYRGRRINIKPAEEAPHELLSYWDGGRKTAYTFIDLATMKAIRVGDTHPYFDSGKPNHLSVLPDGIVLVAEEQGYWHSVTIYGRLAIGLPAPTAKLSTLEQATLYATRSLKSSYGGHSDFRAYELQQRYHCTLDEVTAARMRLRDLGFIGANRAITPAGRNYLEAVGINHWPERG